MTIPFALPFGRRRVLLSIEWLPAAPNHEARPVFDDPAAYEATDRELARLNGRATAAEERLRWEIQMLLYGFRR